MIVSDKTPHAACLRRIMMRCPAFDDKIDDLYKLPLAEFTAARNALAKSLSGDDAKRVKALAKPNARAVGGETRWYWRARGVLRSAV